MIDPKTMGKAIRKERKRQLLTIEKLAEMAGITENFLGKIERGEGVPSLQTIDSIACALHVSIDFLKDDTAPSSEYLLARVLMEVDQMDDENRETFIDFIHTNIKYFQ